MEEGVAETPTAFVATYGSGKPVIGILGEFDALPGISQKASPKKEPLVPGGAGHGCGHNMFGTASLGAAVAIKKLIEQVFNTYCNYNLFYFIRKNVTYRRYVKQY